MKTASPIQSLLVLWALWECINAALSTFAGPLDATYGVLGAHTMTGAQLVTAMTIDLAIAALFYLLRPVSLAIVAA